MTKLIGSIMIISASLVLGIKNIKYRAQRLEALKSTVQMLKYMEDELSSYLTPMPQLLRNINRHTSGVAKKFLKCLNENFPKLGQLNFADIWEISSNESIGILSTDELNEFIALGKSLGHYDVSMQIQAINICRAYMENSIERINARLPETRRLYLGISFACGTLFVILLI